MTTKEEREKNEKAPVRNFSLPEGKFAGFVKGIFGILIIKR